ncbi:MAG: hypothetical protein K0S34_778 [Bacillales bacterium]|nr:hypothetical protein [Bacillales bacterium]
MSKYTTELRYIFENEKLFPPIEGSLSLTNILQKYPLENETFIDPKRKDSKTRREVLNDKIVEHYYFREIGFETVPRFLFCLQRKLNEIMPLYNQMYESVDLPINPLENTDMTETFEHTIDDNSTTTSTGDSTSGGENTTTIENLNVESDTPATELTETDIKSNLYASKTNFDKNTNVIALGATGHSEGEMSLVGTKTETYTRTEKGSSKGGGTFSQNLEQWRNVMINVDMMIIDELKDLFMNVW